MYTPWMKGMNTFPCPADRATFLLEIYPQTAYQNDAVALLAESYTRMGNATLAARQLGISRTTLWRKLREYGIAPPAEAVGSPRRLLQPDCRRPGRRT